MKYNKEAFGLSELPDKLVPTISDLKVIEDTLVLYESNDEDVYESIDFKDFTDNDLVVNIDVSTSRVVVIILNYHLGKINFIGGVPGKEFSVLIINEGNYTIGFNNLNLSESSSILYKGVSLSSAETFISVKFIGGDYYEVGSHTYGELNTNHDVFTLGYGVSQSEYFSGRGSTVGITRIQDGKAYTFVGGETEVRVPISGIPPI